ncbi:MAG: YjbQ family protein [Anaerolineales bacterium]|nr:YjbQ family protein [Anaerolineales bacterium]
MEIIRVQTCSKNELIDITDQVQAAISEIGSQEGLVSVFIQHTTAGVTINENADPDVVRDILSDLARLIPENQSYYRHFEGNSASHLKASLVGISVTIPLVSGRMALGRWQGIYFCEFDGPRTRSVMVNIIPSEPLPRV